MKRPGRLERRVSAAWFFACVLGVLGVLCVTLGGERAHAQSAAPTDEGFQFGGYGRVGISTDLEAARGKPHTVVSHGTRLEEPLYAEMDFRYRKRFGELRLLIHTTLGFLDEFFHFSGKWDARIAIRNMYAEAEGLWDNKLSLWIGSRMYRGDDIYLFNWWPLDNQNTIGGGVGGPVYKSADGSQETILQGHIGQQRLDNAYQFQQVPVVAPFGFGTS